MLEDINNNSEVDLHYLEPREHVEIMKDILTIEEYEEYFTLYSILMSEDSINCFYGGTVKFGDEGLKYNEEKSKDHVERVKDRLGWLKEFEYTPLEIRELTKEFLEEFKEKDLSSAKEWTEVVDSWVKSIRPLAREIRKKGNI